MDNKRKAAITNSKDTLSMLKASVAHMSEIFQCVKTPRDFLIHTLKDEYYIALLCEVCRLPSDDSLLWYKIHKPKELISKILPLANAGLLFATMLNSVSGLGRIFGIPTPVLQDETFTQAKQFLKVLETDSLQSYPQLQQTVAELHSTQSSDPMQSQLSMTKLQGYCIREFGNFLAEVDPKKRWGKLSSHVDCNGNLFFACPMCCAGGSSDVL